MSGLRDGADVVVALYDIDYEQGEIHAAAENDKGEVLYQIAIVGIEEIHWYPDTVTFAPKGQLPESALKVGSPVIVKNAEHRIAFSRGIIQNTAVSRAAQHLYD